MVNDFISFTFTYSIISSIRLSSIRDNGLLNDSKKKKPSLVIIDIRHYFIDFLVVNIFFPGDFLLL